MRPGAWHCPDTGLGGTANCDPVYAGLVNQAYGMAKQWARYRVDPGKYNYQPGRPSPSSAQRISHRSGHSTAALNPVERRRKWLRGSTSHHREPGHRRAAQLHALSTQRRVVGRLPWHRGRLLHLRQPQLLLPVPQELWAYRRRQTKLQRQQRFGVGDRPGRHHPQQPQHHTNRGRPRHHSRHPGGRHRSGRRIQRARPALRVGRRRWRRRTEQRLRPRRR